MKIPLQRLFDEKHWKTGLLLLIGAAFAIRLIPLAFFVDAPGDGPMRAVGAFIWSRCPYIGIPDQRYLGFTYAAGIVSYFFESPLVAARILNFILGTLTVFLFYGLIRRLYGHQTAIFSGTILALLPLHVGLSAGSLTETSFLFELVAGVLFLILAAENPGKRPLCLAASLVCIAWATMTRFESWMFLPLFPAYYYWKTKSAVTSAAMIVALGSFPLAWMSASYFQSADLLSGYLFDAERGAAAVGQEPVGLLMGALVILDMMARNLGLVVVVGIGGLIWQISRLVIGKASAEQMLYLTMVLLFWAFTLYFASQRGWSLWNRYLLFGIVTLLPFIILPFVSLIKSRPHVPVLILVTAISSIVIATVWGMPSVHLRPWQPTAIKNLASWLATSPYRDDAVLLTRMDWQSTYLPLYFPALASCPERRFSIVSYWAEDSSLRAFIRSQSPALLITRNGDDRFQSRVDSLLGAKVHTGDLVHRENEIEVYDIRPYVTDWKTVTAP